MSLLRAKMSARGGWWEIKLLDLNVVAEGSSEDEMLRELEHVLTAEYHLALKHGRTPFFNLLEASPSEVCPSWEEDNKKLRQLNLPQEVRAALAAAFRMPTLPQFNIQSGVDSEAA